jgi:formate/nitrite transporter
MAEYFNSPKETVEKLVDIGKGKCELKWHQTAILAFFAGAYIAFGAALATMVGNDISEYLGVGMQKLMMGGVFSVGLMLVVIAGAELFTGNNLIVVSACTGHSKWMKLFKNWFWVYVFNFVGAVFLAWLIFASGLWKVNGYNVGVFALKIASSKTNLGFLEALTRGILCNWLVCLAVIMAIASKNVIGKIFGIFFPITAFVASGFEHSVANMYFIPIGLFMKTQNVVVQAANLNADKLNNLTFFDGFLWRNLVPVTLGNIIGGAFFVSFLYFLALKPKKACEFDSKR